jgi:hypothetical protein
MDAVGTFGYSKDTWDVQCTNSFFFSYKLLPHSLYDFQPHDNSLMPFVTGTGRAAVATRSPGLSLLPGGALLSPSPLALMGRPPQIFAEKQVMRLFYLTGDIEVLIRNF